MFRRYCCVRQVDQSDCGPAALATVALHYRRRVGREALRDLAGTNRTGTNLKGMVSSAEGLGFMAKAAKGTWDALPKIPLPAIVHIVTEDGLGHFVVLHRVKSKHVVVADPGRGVVKLSRGEFETMWTGYLIVLVPDQARWDREIARETPRPVHRFVKLVLQHKSTMVRAFMCSLLVTGLGIGTSYFVQHLVDSILVRSDTTLLNALGIGMLCVVGFRAAFTALRQYFMAYIARQTGLSLIADYTRHVLRLPIKFFAMRQVGEIMSRVQDAAKVRDAISGVALTAVVDGVMVVACISILWIYDVELAIVASLFVPLLVASVMGHHPAAMRRSRSAAENNARLQSHLVEDMSGAETVKLLGIERHRSTVSDERLVDLLQSAFSLQKLGVSASSMALLVVGAANIVILWYGGHRVMAGALTPGQLLFFYTLLGYLLQPLERLASVNLQVQDALVAIDRLYQIMDLELEDEGISTRPEFPGVQRHIELRDVEFSYSNRRKDKVLNGVNLMIPAGKSVGIVGPSGGGKSTLIKLLTRLYDADCGQVLLDGTDIRDYDLASLRSRIGFVSQDPFVFQGTVRNNILLGNLDASLEDVIAAARIAGLDEVIANLPDRYETIVGERGVTLSGGQRQRLAIARALLRKPDVLVFDEATSALDSETERDIQQRLASELAGRTVVTVAHRLSTIKNADVIYVIENGTIAQAGCHDELVACEGRYADLWRAQVNDARRAEPLAA